MPHPILSGYLPVENGRLFYEIAGGGPPLVFLHGFTLDHRMWDDAVGLLPRPLHGHPLRPARPRPLLRPRCRHALVERRRPHAAACPPRLRAGAPLRPLGRRRHRSRFRRYLPACRAVAHPHRLDHRRLPRLVARDARPPRPAAADRRDGHGRRGRARALARQRHSSTPALEQPDVAQRLRRIVGDYRGWHWLNQGHEFVPDPLPYDRLDEVSGAHAHPRRRARRRGLPQHGRCARRRHPRRRTSTSSPTPATWPTWRRPTPSTARSTPSSQHRKKYPSRASS